MEGFKKLEERIRQNQFEYNQLFLQRTMMIPMVCNQLRLEHPYVFIIVTIKHKRQSSPVFRTREEAEKYLHKEFNGELFKVKEFSSSLLIDSQLINMI